MTTLPPDPSPSYRACSRCIMDSRADPAIVVDADGLCNHCRRYDALAGARMVRGEAGRRELERTVGRIRDAGRGRDYDCIIGVSGGVDSTYVAYLVRRLGLRPLAVHFDNGWNSELAVKNIEQVLKRLDIDLMTHVVDWEEFRDLQLAFLRASTPDGEVPTDHAIQALLWREAVRHGVRHIVSGMNFATESISIADWSYGHSDWRYIRSVHARFGSRRLSTYPRYGLGYLLYVNAVRRIRIVSVLNYVDYDKQAAMKVLRDELGWQHYGGKHHESIYTRFYQGYVLPRKFGVDKRYGHLSDLVNAGQLTREQALAEIAQPPYPEALQQQDLEYVTRKLGLTRPQFDAIMRAPVKSFRDYPNSYERVQMLRHGVNRLRGLGLYPR